MSKETEPILSRRQLREKSAQKNGAPEKSAAPAGVTPVSPAPAAPKATAPETPAPEALGQTSPAADAALPRERESQIRARDRAALRAFKELADAPAQGPLPSRKALRQAQLDAERAPITALNPVVSVRATAAKVPGSLTPGPATQPSPLVASADAAPEQSTPEQNTPEQSTPEQSTPEQSTAKSQGAQSPAVPSQEPASASAADTASATAPLTASVPGPRARGGRRAAAVANNKLGGTGHPATGRGENNRLDNPPVPAVPAGVGKVPNPPTTKPGNGSASSVAPEVPVLEVPQAPTVEPSIAAETVAESAHELAVEASSTQGQHSPESGTNFPTLPGLVPGGDYYPSSAGPPVAPSAPDLQLLAAEKAEAERTAILAQRAQARERLAQENAKNRRPAADPTATNNLAMVTPMEFIDVPGVERPVMRPPATTHVPIVTRSTPRQAPARPAAPNEANSASTPGHPASSVQGAPKRGASGTSVPNVSAERFDAALAARAVHRPGPGNRPLTGGRSSTLKRAEAMAAVDHGAAAPVPSPVSAASSSARPVRVAADAAPVQRSQMPPMPADYAHGLEPLDAMTAGLGRTQRNLLIQWGSIILGGAAFVAGAIMVLTNILN